MHIVNTFGDIHKLKASGVISQPLARHLERKLAALKVALEPETDMAEFSLAMHGPFGILEAGDKNLSAIGLSESLAEVMPEWVSRLEVSGEVYYVLYVMSDNDYVVQVYLPDDIVEGTIRAWLNEQPAEEEGGDYGDEFEPSQSF